VMPHWIEIIKNDIDRSIGVLKIITLDQMY
jgi:hypothetical protein